MGELKFSGNKGYKAPQSADDTLFSTDLVEVVLGISEGPIRGLVNGARSFYVGETRLRSLDGENNFDDFELVIGKGRTKNEKIKLNLGRGPAVSTNVNVDLVTNDPIIRDGSHTELAFLDVRLVINRLYLSTKNGTLEEATGRIKIEYRKQSSSNWKSATVFKAIPDILNEEDDDKSRHKAAASANTVAPSPGDRKLIIQNSTPAGATNAIWVNPNQDGKPYIYSGGSWSPLAGNSPAGGGLFIRWTWSEKSPFNKKNKTTNLFFTSPGHNGKPKNAKQGDLWVKGTNAWLYNGSAFVKAGTTTDRNRNDPDDDTGWTVNGDEIIINGKTSGAVVREFRLKVPSIDEPYSLRVTKLSPLNGTVTGKKEYFFDVSWESFQEIKDDPLKVDYLAYAHFTARASDQFSSVPEFSGVYQGRVIKVPSNYNPDTKTYSGTWDLTYQNKWTDNPASIVQDLVENTRYGLARYYDVELNKLDIYEAMRWCDRQVPKKGGGTRPRFTFNGTISDPRSARETIDYICGIFGGRFIDDGNGRASIKIDKNDAAVHLFARENVVDGVFNYSFTELSSRYNDITVTFRNPDLNWQEDRRRVYDQPHINKYGRIPHDFIAVGCISADEAIGRAKYKLVTALTETTIVNFKTNRQGLYLSPYDIVLVADENNLTGITGRVQEVLNSRTVRMRDEVYLEKGVNYWVRFTQRNGDVVRFKIPNDHRGVVKNLRVVGDLPNLAENSTFVIENDATLGLPKPYRIISITEVENDPDQVEIVATEVNRLKWKFADDPDHDDSAYKQFRYDSDIVAPVVDLRVTPVRERIGTRIFENLVLDWDKSPTPGVRKYRVRHSINNSALRIVGETKGSSYEFKRAEPGNHTFVVTAVGAKDRESRGILIDHDLIGDGRSITTPIGMRVADVKPASDDSIQKSSPVVVWEMEEVDEVNLGYKVSIVDPDTDEVVREEFVESPSYQYDFLKNLDDGGGTPRRTYKVRVEALDQFDDLSDPVEIVIENPPPPVPSNVVVTSSYGGIRVTYDRPDREDIKGVRIHVGATSGFTPTTANLVYDGVNTAVDIAYPAGSYYVKLAVYDEYGIDDLNYTSGIAITVPTFDEYDTVAPDAPTAVNALAGFNLVALDWTAPTATDVRYIEVWAHTANTVGSAKLVHKTPNNAVVVDGLLPNTAYWFWLRAVDHAGNQSGFTTAVTATTRGANTAEIANAAITAAKIGSEQVGANALATNAVIANKIANAAIIAGKIGANAVTANEIAAGSVGANQIAADSITAKHLIVTDFSTINLNPDFAYGVDGWVIGYDPGNVVVLDKITDGTGSLADTCPTYRYAEYTSNGNSGTRDTVAVTRLPVESGQQYYVEGWFAASADYVGSAALHVRRFSATAGSPTTIQSFTPTTTWQKFSASYTVSTGIIRINVGFRLSGFTAGKIYFTGFRVRRKQNAELIVDGAVTTDKMTANTINGDRIQANTLNANKIVAGSITSVYIAAGAIDTTQLAAEAVVANKIATGAVISNHMTANTIEGDRIKANSLNADKIIAGSITTGLMTANTINGDRIQANTLNANKIVAGSITANELATNAVIANKIAAGAITGDKISANTITASRLIIGLTAENLVPDGSFESDALADNWDIADIDIDIITDPTAESGGKVLQLNRGVVAAGSSGTQRYLTTARMVPISSGTKYKWEWTIKSSQNTSTGAYFRIYWFKADGTASATSYTGVRENTEIATTWTTENGIVTPPADARFAKVRLYHNNTSNSQYMWIDKVYLAPAVDETRIEDGAITVNKMADLTITANKIANLTIDASKIANLTITRGKIRAREITDSSAVFTLSSTPVYPSGGGWFALQSKTVTAIEDCDIIVQGSVRIHSTTSVIPTTAGDVLRASIEVVVNNFGNLFTSYVYNVYLPVLNVNPSNGRVRHGGVIPVYDVIRPQYSGSTTVTIRVSIISSYSAYIDSLEASHRYLQLSFLKR